MTTSFNGSADFIVNSGITGPLSILVLDPVFNSVGNSINSTIFAKFNNPIQTGTVHFSVVDGSGNNIAGSITYDAVNKIVNYNRTFPLNLSADYVASVSGVTDTFGSVRSPFSWSFQTANTLGGSSIGSHQYLIRTPDGRQIFQLKVNIN